MMAVWIGLRIAPPCLLRASGEFVGADGAPANPAMARRIVVSRALCHFERYPRRAGLEGRQLEHAARLHASAHGPFARSDFALFRQPDGVAIWYWDRGRVEQALEGRRPYHAGDFTPEGAGPALEDGATLIARSDGAEAQRWEAGALHFSLWRRRSFTKAQWREFAGDGADPMPVERTIDPLAARVRGRVHAAPEWPVLERAIWTCAATAVAFCTFFLGQIVSLDAETRRARSVADAALAGASPELRDNSELVRAYAKAAPGVRHLHAAADALDAVEELGFAPTRWSVTETRFEASFADMPAADLAALAARLEGEARLTQVRARRERSGRGAVIDAEIRQGQAGAS